MRRFSVLLAGAVLLLAGCSSQPSFDTVARDCGDSGIISDSKSIVVEPGASTDTLVCVTDKLLTDQTQQYEVAQAVDAGTDTTLHLGGYTILVVNAGSGMAVSFAR